MTNPPRQHGQKHQRDDRPRPGCEIRRVQVRGQANTQKREYIAASAQNLELLMRHHYRMGTPRRNRPLRR